MHGRESETEEILGKAYDARLVKRLLAALRPHRKLVATAMLFMFLSTGVDLVLPYLTKIGIDRYLARLYLVYEGPAALCDSLAATDPQHLRYLPAEPGMLLVRKSERSGLEESTHRLLVARGTVHPETYYLFPATERRGDTGSVRGGYWLVPEQNLSAVPPAVLVRMRGADLAGITRLAGLMGLLIVFGLVVGYGHVFTLQVAGQRVLYDLRTGLFQHIQTLSLRFFDGNPTGRLVTRVTNDIEALNEMFSAVLLNLVKDVLLIAGTLAILFGMNTRLALTALVVIPGIVLVSLVFRARVRGAYRAVRRHLAALNAGLAEDISGVKVIQAFRREAARRELFRRVNDDYFRANVRQLVIFGIFRPLVEILATAGVALVLVYGGRGVLGGTLTLGALVAFLSYVRGMFQPVADMSEKYNVMQSAMAAAERVYNILDTEPVITESPAARVLVGGASGERPPLRGSASLRGDAPRGRQSSQEGGTTHRGHGPQQERAGRVEFREVSFAYNPETPVLHQVSFTVEPGRSVAIVGPTGAGKTSILNLLCRFYDPDEGAILLDGRDLRELPFATLREEIAIVLQEAFIFSRPVQENITLGAPITGERLRRAADMVQAQEFIDRLPGGYGEVMAERGATLSTGQRQLLCFARALAHDPRVLILDEATSSVDPATEQAIQAAIETLMRGRTSILVAHRLSTIQKADEILVLDGGRIRERGTHQELLARRGIYHNLYLLQYSRG
jgi:ABC-type multidrug transport system fused ATPase/permease subunit